MYIPATNLNMSTIFSNDFQFTLVYTYAQIKLIYWLSSTVVQYTTLFTVMTVTYTRHCVLIISRKNETESCIC